MEKSSEIFNFLMDFVENEPEELSAKQEPEETALFLKEELVDESILEDDIDDILEEKILTEKIKELKDSNSEGEDELNDIIGLPKKSEKLDYTEHLTLVSTAIGLNRQLKEHLQRTECRLLALKRQYKLEEEQITQHSLKITHSSEEPIDFYTSFLTPYFRDGHFACPPNPDQLAKEYVKSKLKEELGLYQKWTLADTRALEVAIKDTIISNYLKSVESQARKKKSEKSIIASKLNFVRNSGLDKILKEMNVEPFDWDVISTRMKKPHSTRDCKAIWDLYMNPCFNKASWKKKECLSLLQVAKTLKFQNWDKIAEKLNTRRSGFQCFVKYQRHLSKREYSWTRDEFSLLKRIIVASKINNEAISWSKVMFYFESCNFEKIYSKWYKSMCSSGIEEARKGRFDFSEDKCILQAVKRDGIPLRDIPKILPSRNLAQIRERYVNSLSQADKKYGAWTKEEDCLLMKLVEKYGAGQWAKIASHIKNRSRTQVRQHYKHIKNVLARNPNITVETYRQRKGCIKKRNRVRELVKKVDTSGAKGPTIHSYNLPRSSEKYGEDAELLKYFIYQRRFLEQRQSIGPTFDQNEEEIRKVCKTLGLQVPNNIDLKEVETNRWQEYMYEAIKYIRKNCTELSSCEPLGNSFSLFPPNLINVYSLRNLMLRLEEEKGVYETSLEDVNDEAGPSYRNALENWLKRLYVLFSIPFMIKNIKLNEYNKIVKKKTC